MSVCQTEGNTLVPQSPVNLGLSLKSSAGSSRIQWRVVLMMAKLTHSLLRSLPLYLHRCREAHGPIHGRRAMYIIAKQRKMLSTVHCAHNDSRLCLCHIASRQFGEDA